MNFCQSRSNFVSLPSENSNQIMKLSDSLPNSFGRFKYNELI